MWQINSLDWPPPVPPRKRPPPGAVEAQRIAWQEEVQALGQRDRANWQASLQDCRRRAQNRIGYQRRQIEKARRALASPTG
jgi:hypothetical protein